ncbi:Zinc finger, C2H2 type [Aphelenchoides besseyi]|nr:Zinc finger, C2H2 type [Aphelenchoides besseyi]KAI6194559.1 Zinc finger, C2H2 type [Aphelenchoides besseyi]
MSDWGSIDKGFDVKPDLSGNVATINGQRDSKPYKCQHCVKAFANNSYLTQHMRIHLNLKPFGPCQYCSRRFTQLSHLQQHLRTHTGEKPYKCKFADCDKSFSQLSNLQSHSRCHQNDRPFKCNSCYKAFNDETALLEHIPKHKESKHLKVHICNYCGKSYTQALYLEKHMAKHADRRDQRKYNNYGGEFSNESFESLSQLNNLSQLNQNSGVSLRKFVSRYVHYLRKLVGSFQQQMAAVAASASNTPSSTPNGTVTMPSLSNYGNYQAIPNQVIAGSTLSPLDIFHRSFQRENVPGALRNGTDRSLGFNMITPLEDIKHFNQNAAASFNNCA